MGVPNQWLCHAAKKKLFLDAMGHDAWLILLGGVTCLVIPLTNEASICEINN